MVLSEGIEPSPVRSQLTNATTTPTSVHGLVEDTGFEPVTYRLSADCSTTELILNKTMLVLRIGFEPVISPFVAGCCSSSAFEAQR